MKDERIPTNLDEAVNIIVEQFKDYDDTPKRVSEEEFMALTHHGFGMSIRNNWGLWTKDSPLVKYFNDKGIYHGDDMSSIILVSVYRKINGKEIDLDGQIKEIRDYWEKVNPLVNTGEL